MRKAALLLLVALAAALLAGCVGGAPSSKPADSDTPVASGAPAPTLTPTPDNPATVDAADGVSLVYAIEQSEIVDRLRDPAGSLSGRWPFSRRAGCCSPFPRRRAGSTGICLTSPRMS